MSISDRPNRFPWPPVLAILLFVFGLLTRLVLPDIRIVPGQHWLSAVIAVLGVALICFAFITFIRHQSNMMPHRAADKLLTSGAFRLSRNPIYTGEIITFLGIGIALGALGSIASTLLLALLVQKFGIEREEAHLAARFPDAWPAYRARVRRWL